MVPYPRTWAEIDLAAMARNLALIGDALDSTAIALVAKADAYGHGLVPVCRWAHRHGVSRLAVATVQEGIALRDAGVTAPVIVLSPTLPVEAQQAVFYELSVTVEGAEAAQALSDAAKELDQTARVHLKIDTGLSRFGCAPDAAGAAATAIRALPNVELEGISQHFSHGAKDPEVTKVQLRAFNCALAQIDQPGIVHAASGAAALTMPETRFDMVRLGLLAYGIDPLGVLPALEPILRWVARVTALRNVPEGSGVGYEHRWVAPRDSRVATVGVGYGDGYLRTLSDRGFVAFEGKRLPIIGLVCMDQMMVDATGVGIEIGHCVELIGPGAPAAELAKLAATTPHEITTRLMPRVPRRYIYE